MKKIIAFDLDGTLAPSKSALPDEISTLLSRLLQKYEVCVISGGKFGQFETQLLGNLEATPDQLQRLHIMPTCGTKYYLYDIAQHSWEQQYAEDIADNDKKRIIKALEMGIDKLGLREAKPWGSLIEDRGSQVTFSALGQEAPVDAKEKWDPKGEKKHRLRDEVALAVPDFEVRAGGSTSIDVTKLGIDKAYGIEKLLEMLHASKEEVLFIGDRLEEGGNDYPVKAMGVESIAVTNWKDTACVIQGILGVS